MSNGDQKQHRGHFQAQGGGLEESENWAQNKPLTVGNALHLIARLIAKLSRKNYEKREREFDKLSQFVVEAGKHGGVFAKESKSFRVKDSKEERLDVEVLAGQAFVPDEGQSKK